MALSSFLRRLWIARPARLTQPAKPGTKVSRKLLLEQLEERMVLSPYVVTTTADSGTGSLRDAINQINADTSHTLYPSSSDSTKDEIDFNIQSGSGYDSGNGIATLTPLSALPTITEPVVLDATTQPAYSTYPLIELNGVNAGAGVNGLTLTGGNSIVKGLDIGGFSGAGIDLTTNGGDLVVGN
jgi:hypothetical protein